VNGTVVNRASLSAKPLELVAAAPPIAVLRDLVDWGIEEGHTTAEKLRLTVEARRETVAKLIKGGMSQRGAAKALGVDEGTVRNDLRKNSAQDAEKPRTKAERRAERELELASKQTALPDKRYGVIVADPEWRFEPYSRETGMDRAARPISGRYDLRITALDLDAEAYGRVVRPAQVHVTASIVARGVAPVTAVGLEPEALLNQPIFGVLQRPE
jgi:transposase